MTRKHKITDELLKISESQTFDEALKEFKYYMSWSKESRSPIMIGRYELIKKRCLCHGMLRCHFIAIINVKTNIPAMIGKDCAKLFPNLDRHMSHIDIDKIRSKIRRQYDNKDINFDLFKNITEALNIVNASQKERKRMRFLKRVCSMVQKKISSEIFDFGKHSGKSIIWVFNHDPGYIKFILSNKFKPIKRNFDTTQYMFFD